MPTWRAARLRASCCSSHDGLGRNRSWRRARGRRRSGAISAMGRGCVKTLDDRERPSVRREFDSRTFGTSVLPISKPKASHPRELRPEFSHSPRSQADCLQRSEEAVATAETMSSRTAIKSTRGRVVDQFGATRSGARRWRRRRSRPRRAPSSTSRGTCRRSSPGSDPLAFVVSRFGCRSYGARA
jgi:hypothetical protein